MPEVGKLYVALHPKEVLIAKRNKQKTVYATNKPLLYIGHEIYGKIINYIFFYDDEIWIIEDFLKDSEIEFNEFFKEIKT